MTPRRCVVLGLGIIIAIAGVILAIPLLFNHATTSVALLIISALFPISATLTGWEKTRVPASAVLLATGCMATLLGALKARSSIHFLGPSWILSWASIASVWPYAAPIMAVSVGLCAIAAGAGGLARRRNLTTSAMALASICMAAGSLWSAGMTVYFDHRYHGGPYSDFADWARIAVLGLAALMMLALALGINREPKVRQPALPAWGPSSQPWNPPSEVANPATPSVISGAGRQRRACRGHPVLVTLATVGAVVLCTGIAGGSWWLTHRKESIDLASAFPDAGLRSCIARTLDKPVGQRISPDDLDSIFGLKCTGNGTSQGAISNLTGIGKLKNLSSLDITDQRVTSLMPLSDSRKLTSIKITGNPVTDISPIAGLTNLSNLGASKTGVSNISSLAGLTRLQNLGLSADGITDLTALASLRQLTELDVSENGLTDLGPLAALSRLAVLDISKNPGVDVSTLGAPPQLNRLVAGSDGISDPKPLCRAPRLQHLDLRDNKIADANLLTGCQAVTELWLGDNPLRTLAPLAALPALQGVDLQSFRMAPNTTGWQVLKAKGIYVGGMAK